MSRLETIFEEFVNFGSLFHAVTAASAGDRYNHRILMMLIGTRPTGSDWTVYLGFRRIDRRLHRLVGKPYPYVLPGRIDR